MSSGYAAIGRAVVQMAMDVRHKYYTGTEN